MRLFLPAVGLSAVALLTACSGGTHPHVNSAHSPTTTGTGATPDPAQTPTSPDRLPNPVQSSIPVGSKTLYTGAGRGGGSVTLPASAGKASSIKVMWTCAGPSKFSVIAAGETLVGSQCGDGSGVFTAAVPHANVRDVAWKFTADTSVIWRIVILQPSGN